MVYVVFRWNKKDGPKMERPSWGPNILIQEWRKKRMDAPYTGSCQL